MNRITKSAALRWLQIALFGLALAGVVVPLTACIPPADGGAGNGDGSGNGGNGGNGGDGSGNGGNGGNGNGGNGGGFNLADEQAADQAGDAEEAANEVDEDLFPPQVY